MEKYKELSATELEIMEVFWNSVETKTHVVLLAYFNEEKNRGWKPQTLTTYTAKLLEKGMITAVRNGRTMYYTAAISQNEYESLKAKGIVDTLYEGSVNRFMIALYEGKGISDDEMIELKKWLADK